VVGHVAEHPRRSVWVGRSTYWTILGNRFAPWLVDLVLARTNVRGQQAPSHDPASDRSNTWSPVPGDAGAHGEFDDEATEHAPLLALTLRPRRTAALAAAAGAVGVGAAALVRGHRRSGSQVFARVTAGRAAGPAGP
jgi:hypothetical protein